MNPEDGPKVYPPMPPPLTVPALDDGAFDLEVEELIVVEGPDDAAELVDALTFEVYYRETYPSVARALGYTLGDWDLAREATDEAMARTYAHWGKVAGYHQPAAWTYRVGLNWARSRRRRLVRSLPLPNHSHPERPAHDPPVADPSLRAALAKLDVDLRSVVVCRLLLDWSVDDTATALGIKAGTVKSRLHRALSALQRSLYHLDPNRTFPRNDEV